jgi:AraC-like DNA-binding protein
MSATDLNGVVETSLVPAPLRPFAVYRGDDPATARSAVSDTISGHQLRIIGSPERFRMNHFAAAIGKLTLCYVHFGAAVEIRAPGTSDRVCIQFPLGGRSEVRCGTDRVVASRSVGTIPSISEPLVMRWSEEAAHLVICVEPAVVEGQLASLLGATTSEPVRTDLGLNLTGTNGMRWFAILDMLQAEINQAREGGGAPLGEVRAAAIEDLVINTLLLQHPNNYWERLSRREAPARTPYVRRAVEYIHENLDTPITTAVLAEVTGVSGRSLQAGFARDFGCSPSAYVRDQRLARVNAELLAADWSDGTRVTDVALQAGFSHLGRFSSAYRQRFGERPSETLRRRAS